VRGHEARDTTGFSLPRCGGAGGEILILGRQPARQPWGRPARRKAVDWLIIAQRRYYRNDPGAVIRMSPSSPPACRPRCAGQFPQLAEA
jgi:hypothetical protein